VTGPRRQAREAALQILYFSEVGRAAPQAAIETYFAEHQPEAADPVRRFAATLVHGATDERDELDRLIEQHSRHWRLERMAIIDRLILRMAVWELRHETGTPAAVVLNEALELARRFSTDDAVRFVNGILDAVCRTVRDGRAEAPGS
jgi:transcription antitermination protein NusB